MKPKSINIIKSLLLFRLSITTLIIIIFYFIKDLESNQKTFWSGFKNGIISSMDIVNSNPNILFSYLLGELTIPIILIILQINFINKRLFTPILITVILDLLLCLSKGFILFPIITFIFIHTQPAKNYLKKLS